jgi:hypothetical protein
MGSDLLAILASSSYFLSRLRAALGIRCSQLHRLDFVVDFEVEWIEVANKRVFNEGARGGLVGRRLFFQARVKG